VFNLVTSKVFNLVTSEVFNLVTSEVFNLVTSEMFNLVSYIVAVGFIGGGNQMTPVKTTDL
jgi:hypothetical protein